VLPVGLSADLDMGNTLHTHDPAYPAVRSRQHLSGSIVGQACVLVKASGGHLRMSGVGVREDAGWPDSWLGQRGVGEQDGCRQVPGKIRSKLGQQRVLNARNQDIATGSGGSNQDGGVLIPVCPLAAVPLRRLAAYLRMLGDDPLYSDAPGDRELAVIANAEGRGGEPREPLVGGVALLGPVRAL
jgi:hypothetical protein